MFQETNALFFRNSESLFENPFPPFSENGIRKNYMNLQDWAFLRKKPEILQTGHFHLEGLLTSKPHLKFHMEFQTRKVKLLISQGKFESAVDLILFLIRFSKQRNLTFQHSLYLFIFSELYLYVNVLLFFFLLCLFKLNFIS